MVLKASPARTQAVLGLVAAAALVVLAASADGGARVLAVPAVLLLLGLACRDLVLRPVLRADPSGITVVDGLTRHAVPWSELVSVRVVTDRRTPLLELDLGDRTVVLSRSRLGRPPADVLAELLAQRP